MSIKESAANVCKNLCPVCKTARKKQEGACYWFVKNVDRKVCPFCKSYESVYGRLAYEPEPNDKA
ncbi:MAG: hypothetical protein SWO11_21360 [Thermodesulfobacteriota bacterium]|nr:hypothetical protein [Thermodesulfobacteriota bacterium]